MTLIDTHCHLYQDTFASDIEAVLKRAENDGVEKFYLPAIDSEVIDKMLALEAGHPGKCIAMMGLHPCSVKENYEEELRIVEDWLARRKFVAVGEIGLDFYWDKTFTAQQYDAFRRQIDLAKQYEIPVVIHSRNAMQECIDVMKEKKDERLRGIFHCFSGTLSEAHQVMELGCYMGIGGVVTFKNGGVAEVVEKVPLEYLVLETDAPYLAPVPFRGKRNESSYLTYIVQKIAEVKKLSVEAVAAVTTANAQKIFGL